MGFPLQCVDLIPQAVKSVTNPCRLVTVVIAAMAACPSFADVITTAPNNEILMDRPNSNLELMEAFTVGNRYRKAGRSVGRVAITFGLGRKGACSGVLITVDYLLTANHCLVDEEYPENKIENMTLYMDDISLDRGTPFRIANQVVESNSTLDYAILRVEGNPGQTFPTAKLDTLDIPRGEELFVIHHPEGERQQLSRRSCRARGPYKDQYSFLHLCDTMKGSSGAPIFSDNSNIPVVVGIHERYELLDGFKLNVGTSISAIASKSCIVGHLVKNEKLDGCPLAANQSAAVQAQAPTLAQ
jgi:hypothetical protein